ncbi:MAG: hypothetical protein ABW298_03790 [Candidatus Binatia bacterium]
MRPLGGTKTHYRHGRTVGLSLRIFDLDDGATVWSGSVEKASWNENREDERDADLDDDHDKHQSVGKDLRDAALAGLAIGALDGLLGDGGASSPTATPTLSRPTGRERPPRAGVSRLRAKPAAAVSSASASRCV